MSGFLFAHTQITIFPETNIDVTFNMSSYALCSVCIAVGGTLSPSRLSVSFSAKWWWLHITWDAASPCETGYLKLLFFHVVASLQQGDMCLAVRGIQIPALNLAQGLPNFSLQLFTHIGCEVWSFFLIGEFCRQALFIYSFIYLFILQ